MKPLDGESATDFLARRKRSRSSFWSYWLVIVVLLASGSCLTWAVASKHYGLVATGFFLLLLGMLSTWGYGKERIQKHIGRELKVDEL